MRRFLTALVSVAALTASSAAFAQDQSQPAPSSGCFFSSNWNGWSAPGDGNVLLLRVRPNDIYRVELGPNTRVHKSSDRFLVNQLRGGSWICSALDLDLTLTDPQGFSQPLIARTLTRLTPDEIAAIPREDLPS
jgi:hypothetical protein